MITQLTEDEFVQREIYRVGYEEVEQLVDAGFEPILTNKGWRWILTRTPQNSKLISV